MPQPPLSRALRASRPASLDSSDRLGDRAEDRSRAPAPGAGLARDPAALRALKGGAQLRRYEVRVLMPDGDIRELRQVAPTLPLFERAFSAFARGTLIDTIHGPVAVEDLIPGDRIVMASGDTQPVTWIGSTLLAPMTGEAEGARASFTRFTADAFGIGRPVAHTLLGPAARLAHIPAHLRGAAEPGRMLVPAREFEDGTHVIGTRPPSAVQVFHLCLPRHAVFRAGGLDVESYHPGLVAIRTISHTMRGVFLSLFPHIGYLGDFGPLALPRSDEQPNAASA